MRVLAWLIDIFIIAIYFTIISAIAFSNLYLFYFLILIVIGFYHLAFEILNNGQSPGKQILKIKVVTLHGRAAKPQDYFLRWIFRMLEITGCLGIIAILYISSTEKNQRIGDMLAQTTVIKLRQDQIYDLKALVRMGQNERNIKYPKVTMYNDTDMMLLKDSMSRFKKDPSSANRKFLTTLAQKIAEDLNVAIDGRRMNQFLETVLYDYITLTR
jgi:uncharacterized RDD family membrane protein YckC